MDQTQRYYLSARANKCYDKTGVTFPTNIAVDFEEIVSEFVVDPQFKWEPQFGWSNQPDVLTFTATAQEVALLERNAVLAENYDFNAFVMVETIWVIK